MSQSDSMSGQVAIVTGGSSGIGRAVALSLANRGASVLITGRNAEALRAVGALHPHLEWIQADLSSADSGRLVVARAIERWGRIDSLINNAGIFAAGPLEAMRADQAMALLSVNLLGPMLMTQAALPHLKASKGAIVNVSSTYGHKPSAGASLYAASKAGLEHLTRSWALELAPAGIRVNAVAPGPTETAILARMGLPPTVLEQIQQREAGQIPLKRRGTAEEVAEWIVQLASAGAAWVTGQILAVDGGLSIT